MTILNDLSLETCLCFRLPNVNKPAPSDFADSSCDEAPNALFTLHKQNLVNNNRKVVYV